MLTMKWHKEAEKIMASAPVPPVMAGLARLDAERRAMLAGTVVAVGLTSKGLSGSSMLP